MFCLTCGLFTVGGSYKVALEAVVAERVLCAVCDQVEHECKCDRYCCICKGQYGIRLCMDGQYYCPDCREACEISTVNSGNE